MDKFAPIVLFTFNRPEHLCKTIDALKKNNISKESCLYIFSDNYKKEEDKIKVEQVRNYTKNISWFKNITIFESDKNKGLACSIIDGITQILKTHDRVIVLEDDLIVSEFFLTFMNKALNFFLNRNDIFSISGYCPPIEIPEYYNDDIFLFQRNNSWGWATWKDRWESVDWNVSDFKDFIKNRKLRDKFNLQGNDVTAMLLKQMTKKINSWSIRFNYSCFKQNKLNVYPKHSLIENIGSDGSGSHVKKTNKFIVKTAEQEPEISNINLTDKIICRNFKKYYDTSLYRKIINLIKIAVYNNKN